MPLNKSISTDSPENLISICHELMPKLKTRTITPLTGGASGSGIYRVMTDDRSYILRILSSDRSLADIEHELNITKLMGTLNVSPQVYATSLKTRSLIMQEIKGKPLWGPHIVDDTIKDIAMKIKIIHQAQPTITLKHRTPRQIAQKIQDNHQYEMPIPFQEAFEKHAPHFKTLETNNYVLSHTDLNPGNILKDTDTGSLKIIDWEDALQTHAYLDMVTPCIFYLLNSENKKLLLETYETIDRTAQKEQELQAAYKIQNFIYALRVLRASYLFPPKGDRPSLTEMTKIKPLFQKKDFATIISMFNKDVTYALAMLWLEESFKDLNL